MVVAGFGEMGRIAARRRIPECMRLFDVRRESGRSLGYVRLVGRDLEEKTWSIVFFGIDE